MDKNTNKTMENVVVLDVKKVDLVLHGAAIDLPNINVIPDEDGTNVDQELRIFRLKSWNKKNPNPRKKKEVPVGFYLPLISYHK